MKKQLLSIVSMLIAFSAQLVTAQEVTTSNLNATYNMTCSPYLSEVLQLKISTVQNIMKVEYTQLNNQNDLSSRSSSSMEFEVANQKKLIRVSDNDDGFFSRKNRTYYETQFTNQSISLVETVDRSFQFGFKIEFNDATLKSGVFTREYYWPGQNHIAPCAFVEAN